MKLEEALYILSAHTTTLVQGTSDVAKRKEIMKNYGEQISKLFKYANERVEIDNSVVRKMFNLIDELNENYVIVTY